MSNRLLLYFHTLKHLKPIQIYYRLFNWLRKRWRSRMGYEWPLSRVSGKVEHLRMTDSIPPPTTSYLAERRFCFLHIEHHFEEQINWDYPAHGKLWTYNLNYFEFLLQKDMLPSTAVDLMHNFIAASASLTNAWEPYPLSLRIIHWIKFLSLHQLRDQKIEDSLYAQAHALRDQLEYHLLGNHLLENGFALFFAAYFFQDKQLHRKATDILRSELEEQIRSDGAHFELSSMYHQLMLFRVLDCYNVASYHTIFDSDISALLKNKAQLMTNWLQRMRFRNGDMPLLNDSAPYIAPNAKALLAYAKRLLIMPEAAHTLTCGYYKFESNHCQCIFDAAAVGPDYIPGHAHSDTLGIIIHVDDAPFLIDPGVSTYEKGERRQLERSTRFHNTVQLANLEQTEIWAGFRVARRAYPQLENHIKNQYIKASHNGYDRIKCKHTRELLLTEASIKITDRISGEFTGQATAFWHFAPGIEIQHSENTVLTEKGNLLFEGHESIRLYRYNCPQGFNKYAKAWKCEVRFSEQLFTTLLLA